ncbi:MAG: hypothetical protein KVP17_002607 [Porospora cf. gigantea B]|uniref:uncharacterized protein n=2 Tax=Porospora cf. gigantea B TaxID=2853592 RepID=UPI003571E2B2|nr:MAG: hypothetical protein KVP17_002607 [Porospora cf. gigantea B]
MHRRKHLSFLRKISKDRGKQTEKLHWPGISRTRGAEALRNGDVVVDLSSSELTGRDWQKLQSLFSCVWSEVFNGALALTSQRGEKVLLYVRPRRNDQMLGLIWASLGGVAGRVNVGEAIDIDSLEANTATVECGCVVRYVWVHPRLRRQKLATLLLVKAYNALQLRSSQRFALATDLTEAGLRWASSAEKPKSGGDGACLVALHGQVD